MKHTENTPAKTELSHIQLVHSECVHAPSIYYSHARGQETASPRHKQAYLGVVLGRLRRAVDQIATHWAAYLCKSTPGNTNGHTGAICNELKPNRPTLRETSAQCIDVAKMACTCTHTACRRTGLGGPCTPRCCGNAALSRKGSKFSQASFHRTVQRCLRLITTISTYPTILATTELYAALLYPRPS